MTAAMESAKQEIRQHLDAIRALFKPGFRITLLGRMPGKQDQDFIMTNDSATKAIAMMQRHSEERSPLIIK